MRAARPAAGSPSRTRGMPGAARPSSRIRSCGGMYTLPPSPGPGGRDRAGPLRRRREARPRAAHRIGAGAFPPDRRGLSAQTSGHDRWPGPHRHRPRRDGRRADADRRGGAPARDRQGRSEERKSLDVSPMPEDLADGLSPEEFADLIAYLGSLRSSGRSPGSGVVGPVALPPGLRAASVSPRAHRRDRDGRRPRRPRLRLRADRDAPGRQGRRTAARAVPHA